MKTILLLSLLSIGTLTTVSTPSSAMTVTRPADSTPAAVKATIARLYPTVKHVKYEKENGDYEAGFTHNGKSMSVLLDASGTVKETETEIPVSALPAAVREYVAKQMPGKKIKEAAEIVDAQGMKKFEAEVGGKDLLFDTTGKPLK
ncbi:hypothetical protein FAES_pFAES01143 (plasmid) [Fibrella aestuarina BUZ 2]|uniref:Putative beta-lactamase-inhibitor-like PepSY-like domain-containing protein n=1 Tax=Fibrella aestuarina BUZ 2 TaxID=1166018 RepID=I0KHN0_9BACT|nr:PepSY-like domain-containing protein [Fibrella aestuarina]CCH03633.1 hypothetical protein FAES_pFAES01143 [Fibrella aestuarina BUZ 2]